MTREGYIEKIIYKSEDSAYAVFCVEGDDGEEIFVGNLYGVGEGLYIIAEGEYVNHPQYDIQFKFTSYQIKMPEDTVGIERYLASGIIKGVREVLAKKIVKKFKNDTLRIIEEEPERLAEISGISEAKARKIAASYMEKREFQDVAIFLGGYGISVNLAMKIYNTYGDEVYTVVKTNPYKMAEDITGIGFKMADQIAVKMGVERDSEFRVRSAIVYALGRATTEGHMYLPKKQLTKRVMDLLHGGDVSAEYGYAEYPDATSMDTVYDAQTEVIGEQLLELVMEGKVVLKQADGEDRVYNGANYYTELNSARMLIDLQLKYEIPEKELSDALSAIQKKEGIALDEQQLTAVRSAITAGVAVITGGPGTGKTTIIDTIIKYFVGQGMEIKLCAPTGRAAKRMTEQTGWPAETIHRLLEFSGNPDEEKDGLSFGRNANNPLECDAIIVDEMSMVDSFLFYSLLSAVAYGTRLILVGDINQLPSVGAGNVLKDVICSDCFPVTTLDKIYRQEEGSDIVFNAHHINKGEHLTIDNKSKDFFFIPRNGSAEVLKEVGVLVSDNLPKYLGVSPLDIEVLAPMRRYDTGVENLNVRLQELLNPPAKGKAEKKRQDVTFRVGDKVMQIKNNYKQEWRIYGYAASGRGRVIDEGVGVFNGDVGTITDISDYDEEVTVLFDDQREAVYSYAALDELEHAFAMTIHKSQGSEYPAVIIPLVSGPKRLLTRNLIYTAITRAKRMVVIVGNIGMVNQMIDNAEEQKRYTSLTDRLQELFDIMQEDAP